MKFHNWIGQESGFSHEASQIKELTKVLQNWSNNIDKSIHLLTNFFIGGEEIDAAIILPNNVVLIELKRTN